MDQMKAMGVGPWHWTKLKFLIRVKLFFLAVTFFTKFRD